MSSILIATVPIHGHVTPMLAVARRFADRGDRVRFLTGARFADADRWPAPRSSPFRLSPTSTTASTSTSASLSGSG